MAANLPPEYYGLENEYSGAKSREEKIKILEKMLTVIPKHKCSQTVIGEIRRKISLLKKETALEAKKKKGFIKKGIKKEGAAQVCIIGVPNTGKSYILNKLCNTNIKSTELPFETTKPELGMMNYDGVQIQLVEIPSVYKGFYEKEGEYRGILKTCDIICFVANNNEEFEFAKKEIDTHDKKFIVCSSYDLDVFRKKVWESLGLIKVYTKEPGKKHENRPVALKQGATIADLGNVIHKDFIKKFRYAKVIRPKDRIKEIRAGLNFMLKDNDIVEFKIA